MTSYQEKSQRALEANKIWSIVSLAGNRLEGPISTSLGNLIGLKFLDLLRNDLSGVTPKSFENLLRLDFFNVPFNHLQEEIQMGEPFQIFFSLSFMHNDDIYGAPYRKIKRIKCLEVYCCGVDTKNVFSINVDCVFLDNKQN